MKRARRSSNRVSWAGGGNLCQVKLFVSEDCPSKVGHESQDHLQAKMSSMLHSSTIEFNDLPPGFECNPLPNQSKYEISRMPQINWRCPPLLVFSYDWHVVAGEESREKEDQKLRELRVLEAVYPRLSSIPPSPSVALDVEEDYDDDVTPLVPIIPIEEEESTDDKPELAAAREAPQNLHQYMSALTAPIQYNTSSSPALNPPPGLEVDLVAASALVNAIMKSSEQGSLIDMDLLVKIFSDPLMIEKLVNDRGTAATTTSASFNTGLKPAAHSVPPTRTSSVLKPEIPPISLSTSMPEKLAIPSIPMSMPGKPAIPSVPLRTPVNQSRHHISDGVVPTLDTQPPQEDAFMATGAMHAASLVSIPTISPMTSQARSTASAMPHQAFAAKDANYLKNLIRQHGSDKQDIQDSRIGIRQSNFQNMKSVLNNKTGQVKYKNEKTCLYFNSPRGCRNGSSCPYQHDISVQGGQNSRRMKN